LLSQVAIMFSAFLDLCLTKAMRMKATPLESDMPVNFNYLFTSTSALLFFSHEQQRFCGIVNAAVSL